MSNTPPHDGAAAWCVLPCCVVQFITNVGAAAAAAAVSCGSGTKTAAEAEVVAPMLPAFAEVGGAAPGIAGERQRSYGLADVVVLVSAAIHPGARPSSFSTATSDPLPPNNILHVAHHYDRSAVKCELVSMDAQLVCPASVPS